MSASVNPQQDNAWQQNEWRVQRIGWFLWAFVIVAALLGLTGYGPLSRTVATTATKGIVMHYDHFVRCHCPTRLRIELSRAAGSRAPRLEISDTLLDNMQIRHIEPEPLRRVLTDETIIYEFAATEDIETATISLHVEYQTFGKVSGFVGVPGGGVLNVSQFVYP